MRSRLVLGAVDSHTEGMPTRVVTSGVGELPGATMAERRLYVMNERDDLRTLLMHEPRGHSAMSGAILQPSTRPDADIGVVFIEVSGCLPMCGHGTIGTATVLVETGMVPVNEPVTVVRFDTPAGLVEASVEVEAGRAKSVTIRNVPAYLHLRDATVRVPGVGEVELDLAWGGNFYALLPAASVGLAVRPSLHDDLIRTGLAVMAAVNDQLRFAHPVHQSIDYCHHVVLTEPGDETVSGRGRGRHLPGVAGPVTVRDGDVSAYGPAPRPRGTEPGTGLRARLGPRDTLHRAFARHHQSGQLRRRGPDGSGPGLGHRPGHLSPGP